MEAVGVKRDLDVALPVWHHAARHQLRIDASPAPGLAAKRSVEGERVPAE